LPATSAVAQQTQCTDAQQRQRTRFRHDSSRLHAGHPGLSVSSGVGAIAHDRKAVDTRSFCADRPVFCAPAGPHLLTIARNGKCCVAASASTQHLNEGFLLVDWRKSKFLSVITAIRVVLRENMFNRSACLRYLAFSLVT